MTSASLMWLPFASALAQNFVVYVWEEPAWKQPQMVQGVWGLRIFSTNFCHIHS